MSRLSPLFTIVPVVALAAAGTPAHATVYMTLSEAQRSMFPGATFADKSVTFTSAQRKSIAKASGVGAPKEQKIWEARDGSRRLGWFILDRVIGKHEYITYAVALSPDGMVRQSKYSTIGKLMAGKCAIPSGARSSPAHGRAARSGSAGISRTSRERPCRAATSPTGFVACSLLTRCCWRAGDPSLSPVPWHLCRDCRRP